MMIILTTFRISKSSLFIRSVLKFPRVVRRRDKRDFLFTIQMTEKFMKAFPHLRYLGNTLLHGKFIYVSGFSLFTFMFPVFLNDNLHDCLHSSMLSHLQTQHYWDVNENIYFHELKNITQKCEKNYW